MNVRLIGTDYKYVDKKEEEEEFAPIPEEFFDTSQDAVPGTQGIFIKLYYHSLLI